MKQPYSGIRRAALMTAMAMGSIGAAVAAGPIRASKPDALKGTDDDTLPDGALSDPPSEPASPKAAEAPATPLPPIVPPTPLPPMPAPAPKPLLRRRLSAQDKERMAQAEIKRFRRRGRKGGSGS